ncbi:carbohydrate ABC transporter permease [Geomicrobium sp. JCM 19039]|uniref:carbohydrate ABC transporter permease n=1 Tax=Geomicrobium sp. JCM 19039 TaxID=1460636 RepID=UPI00045F4B55|nr:sugar ABC transporter permease [Geomicrobium sp. JCM 19039]GAK12691.1 N-acetyl-D-glucosamine ABC transport system, permease protein 1 [Geomicrobium sp. JCM 19039]
MPDGAIAARKTRSPRLNMKQKTYLFVYTCLLIPLIFYLTIRFFPTLYTFNIGFQDYQILTGEHEYVFFDNYAAIFQDPVFIRSLINTIIVIVFGVLGQVILGLAVALLLQKINRFKGLFRVIYFIPYVTSIVAVSWVFRWLFMNNGFVNNFLVELGFSPQGFLGDPEQAIYIIVGTMIWQALGFQMVIFLAGLENIPESFYEAADVDGASAWNKFKSITIPLLNPTIVFSVVIGTITFIQVSFTQVVNMSPDGAGGPLHSTITVVVYIYRLAFNQFNMGMHPRRRSYFLLRFSC